MGETLDSIAQKIYDCDKKVQLIYAFNGVGKTRLSRAFKELVSAENEQEDGEKKLNVIYYNAFTEDLFYWDNDLDEDTNRKIIIRPNNFTKWILEEEGQASNIVSLFQSYTNDKLTPRFSQDYGEIAFSIDKGDDQNIDNIKISKGEESCLIWCIFFSLLKEVAEVLKEPDLDNRTTPQFDELKYVFIDDPVSSLDENHLISLAVDIAELIKMCPKELKFVISTHNPLFYNVLYNELNIKEGYLLSKNEDGTFEYNKKKGDSNKSFSYHLFLKSTLEEAIESGDIQRYHFVLLRNLYEKTANFLGYPKWSNLLPDDQQVYYSRIINFTSHSTLSNEAVAEPTEQEKRTLNLLLRHLVDTKFWKEEQQ